MMTGPDGKVFAWFDVGGGFIFWSAASLASEDSVADQTTTAKQRVQQIFSDWAPALTAMLEATPADDIVERPICDRLPATRWSHGRVTLLGDAAHAMVPALGQGANTAFEDAWELSRALARTPDVEAALASYDKSRTYRTQIIQARSALQGSRSYGADGETFLAGVIAQASATQSEFEDWLYSYDASAFD
jgi:salicylate hydroxylase